MSHLPFDMETNSGSIKIELLEKVENSIKMEEESSVKKPTQENLEEIKDRPVLNDDDIMNIDILLDELDAVLLEEQDTEDGENITEQLRAPSPIRVYTAKRSDSPRKIKTSRRRFERSRCSRRSSSVISISSDCSHEKFTKADKPVRKKRKAAVNGHIKEVVTLRSSSSDLSLSSLPSISPKCSPDKKQSTSHFSLEPDHSINTKADNPVRKKRKAAVNGHIKESSSSDFSLSSLPSTSPNFSRNKKQPTSHGSLDPHNSTKYETQSVGNFFSKPVSESRAESPKTECYWDHTVKQKLDRNEESLLGSWDDYLQRFHQSPSWDFRQTLEQHEQTFYYKKKLYCYMVKEEVEKGAEMLAFHIKNPEKHPQYPDEWIKFWKRHYNDNQKTDNFIPEWIVYWTKRMVQLHDETIEAKKRIIRIQLSLPTDVSLTSEPPTQYKCMPPRLRMSEQPRSRLRFRSPVLNRQSRIFAKSIFDQIPRSEDSKRLESQFQANHSMPLYDVPPSRWYDNMPRRPRDERRPLISRDDRKPLMSQDDRKPLISRDDRKPIISQGDRKLLLSQDDSKPSISHEYRKPLLSRDNRKTLISQDYREPLLSRDDRKPLISRNDRNPSISQDGRKPLLSRDERKPLISQDDRKPLLSRDDRKPLLSRDDWKPIISRYDRNTLLSQDDRKPVISRDDRKPLISRFYKKPLLSTPIKFHTETRCQSSGCGYESSTLKDNRKPLLWCEERPPLTSQDKRQRSHSRGNRWPSQSQYNPHPLKWKDERRVSTTKIKPYSDDFIRPIKLEDQIQSPQDVRKPSLPKDKPFLMSHDEPYIYVKSKLNKKIKLAGKNEPSPLVNATEDTFTIPPTPVPKTEDPYTTSPISVPKTEDLSHISQTSVPKTEKSFTISKTSVSKTENPFNISPTSVPENPKRMLSVRSLTNVESAAREAITHTTTLLQLPDFKAGIVTEKTECKSVSVVDKAALSRILGAALVAQEDRVIPTEELAKLVEVVVAIAEARQCSGETEVPNVADVLEKITTGCWKESARKLGDIEFDSHLTELQDRNKSEQTEEGEICPSPARVSLSAGTLHTLAQNFTSLPQDEQLRMFTHLKKLEGELFTTVLYHIRNPNCGESLRDFVKLGTTEGYADHLTHGMKHSPHTPPGNHRKIAAKNPSGKNSPRLSATSSNNVKPNQAPRVKNLPIATPASQKIADDKALEVKQFQTILVVSNNMAVNKASEIRQSLITIPAAPYKMHVGQAPEINPSIMTPLASPNKDAPNKAPNIKQSLLTTTAALNKMAPNKAPDMKQSLLTTSAAPNKCPPNEATDMKQSLLTTPAAPNKDPPNKAPDMKQSLLTTPAALNKMAPNKAPDMQQSLLTTPAAVNKVAPNKAPDMKQSLLTTPAAPNKDASNKASDMKQSLLTTPAALNKMAFNKALDMKQSLLTTPAAPNKDPPNKAPDMKQSLFTTPAAPDKCPPNKATDMKQPLLTTPASRNTLNKAPDMKQSLVTTPAASNKIAPYKAHHIMQSLFTTSESFDKVAANKAHEKKQSFTTTPAALVKMAADKTPEMKPSVILTPVNSNKVAAKKAPEIRPSITTTPAEDKNSEMKLSIIPRLITTPTFPTKLLANKASEIKQSFITKIAGPNKFVSDNTPEGKQLLNTIPLASNKGATITYKDYNTKQSIKQEVEITKSLRPSITKDNEEKPLNYSLSQGKSLTRSLNMAISSTGKKITGEKMSGTAITNQTKNNFYKKNPYEKCKHCGCNHLIQNCVVFLDLSILKRIQTAESLRLCKVCLKPKHATPCWFPINCDLCGKRHHTILHDDNYTNHRLLLCPFCWRMHSIYKCSSFMALTPVQRIMEATFKNWCLVCLNSHNFMTKCRSLNTCESCGKRHHTLLHIVRKKDFNHK